MNDDQLRNELQARIPEPAAGYWQTLGAELEAIEQTAAFDPARDTASPIGPAAADTASPALDVTRATEPEPAQSQARRTYLVAAAAAIVAILSLGAVLVNSRTSSTVTDEVNLATQPDRGDQVADPSPATDGQESIESVAAIDPDQRMICYQSAADGVVLEPIGAEPLPVPRSLLAILLVDEAEQGRLAMWEDISAGRDAAPILRSTTLALDPQVEFDLTFESHAALGVPSAELVFNVVFTAHGFTVGNVSLGEVPCEQIQPAIDRMYGVASSQQAPSVAEVTATIETPLQAMQARLTDPSDDQRLSLPFCFSGDGGYSILRPGSDQFIEEPNLASVVVGPDGALDVVIIQGREVRASFAAIVAGTPEGIFRVELSIVDAEGATWLDTVQQELLLTDDALIVGPTRMGRAPCAPLQSEIDRLRSRAAEMRAWQAENPD